jgi:hypothetical protein
MLYLVRLKRFARFCSETEVFLEKETPTEKALKHKILKIPGREPWSMWSSAANFTPECIIFALDFDGPIEPDPRICCICIPNLYEIDSDGVQYFRYHIVGLGVALPTSQSCAAHVISEMTKARKLCEFLDRSLSSLEDREVMDGLPDHVLQITLQELIALCQLARDVGAYQPWDLEQVSTVKHWKQDQGPFGN